MGQVAWACRDQCTPSMRATWALCARDMRTLCARHAHSVSATCASLRAASRLCAQQRLRPGCCARSVHATWFLGVRTVHTTQFCDSALFRALFMDTVHEHCSQGKEKKKSTKFLKNFLCMI